MGKGRHSMNLTPIAVMRFAVGFAVVVILGLILFIALIMVTTAGGGSS